jgi:hypothetical protein
MLKLQKKNQTSYANCLHFKAEEETSVQLFDCELKHCKEYAIGVEMNSDSIGETLLGGMELIQKQVPKLKNES